MAGVLNKDKEFWEGIKEWDVVIMMETWLDGKRWERMKEKMPKEFKWKVQLATRRYKKGRANGGMLLGIKRGIVEEKEERRVRMEDGRMECKIKLGEERWRIIGIYVNNNLDEKLEGLKDWMEEREEGTKTVIGGDFNARTVEEGGWKEEEE